MSITISAVGEDKKDIVLEKLSRLMENYSFETKGTEGSILPVSRDELLSDIGKSNLFVAYMESDFAGCVRLVEYGIAELRTLVVEPTNHRKKVGSSLIKKCVERAREKGYEKLYALTKDETKYKNLFIKNGFEYLTFIPDPKLERDCRNKCSLYPDKCNEVAFVHTFV